MILVIAIAVSSVVSGQTKKAKTVEPSVNTQSAKRAPKVLMILEITVHVPTMYEQYRIDVAPLIKKYGGKYLVRSGGVAFDNDPGTKVTPVEGNWNPDRIIIVHWDSVEQLQKFSKSPEYLEVAEIRKRSATTRSIIVKEYLKN